MPAFCRINRENPLRQSKTGVAAGFCFYNFLSYFFGAVAPVEVAGAVLVADCGVT